MQSAMEFSSHNILFKEQFLYEQSAVLFSKESAKFLRT